MGQYESRCAGRHHWPLQRPPHCLRKLPSLPQIVEGVVREATVRLARTPEGEIVGERFVRMPQRHIRENGEIVGSAAGGESPDSLGPGRDKLDASALRSAR